MSVERRATAWLVATTFIWGSTFFSMKMGVAAIETAAGRASWHSGLLFLTLRFFLATILLSISLPRAWKVLNRSAFLDSIIVSLPGVIGIALQSAALRSGSSATVAFITSLTIVTVPVVGWIFLRQKLTPALWIGAALSLLGVFVMTRPWSGEFGWPEVFTLIGTVLFGFQIHFINHYTRKHDPEAITLGAFIHSVWACLLILVVLPGGRDFLDPGTLGKLMQPIDGADPIQRWAVYWTIPYHALFASVVAFLVMMRFQREVHPTRAVIIYCLEPVFAAWLAWWIAREGMSALQLAGAGLVIAGNLACELLRRSEGPVPARPEEAMTPGTPAPPPPSRS